LLPHLYPFLGIAFLSLPLIFGSAGLNYMGAGIAGHEVSYESEYPCFPVQRELLHRIPNLPQNFYGTAGNPVL